MWNETLSKKQTLTKANLKKFSKLSAFFKKQPFIEVNRYA